MCKQVIALISSLLIGCTPTVPVDVVQPTEPTTTIVETVETVEKPQMTEFRVTAYCGCSDCCGKWSENRPVDENGKEIIKGAAGIPLLNGISCASPLPFGTEIYLEGYGVVIVQDRTADWVVDKYGQNIVDIYFDTHEQVMDFALQYIDGRVL